MDPEGGRQAAKPVALIGYARISTGEQNSALQIDGLKAAGCDTIFADTASGSKADRPQLEAALQYLRTGDILVVWKLDRLGRSMRHLVELIGSLGQRQVGFRSLTEAIDATTPAGQLLFHVMGALAQFERDLIRERTRAGLSAAAARGRKGGRPIVVTAEIIEKARRLVGQGLSVREAAARLRVGKSSLYDALAADSSQGHRSDVALGHAVSP